MQKDSSQTVGQVTHAKLLSFTHNSANYFVSSLVLPVWLPNITRTNYYLLGIPRFLICTRLIVIHIYLYICVYIHQYVCVIFLNNLVLHHKITVAEPSPPHLYQINLRGSRNPPLTTFDSLPPSPPLELEAHLCLDFFLFVHDMVPLWYWLGWGVSRCPVFSVLVNWWNETFCLCQPAQNKTLNHVLYTESYNSQWAKIATTHDKHHLSIGYTSFR